MRTPIILPAFAAMCSAQAQQLDGYRFWFNDDVSNAVTTDVAATTELTIAEAWPVGSLPPGHHRVSIQVRDTSGDWSVPQTRYFTRTGQPISSYRFWVNDDVAVITTGTIGPNMVVDLNSVVDPGQLTKDFNTVTIQFQDADGAWSVPVTSSFVKNTGLVNGYAFWIDDDITNSISGTIGPDDLVDLIADLPTGVPAGEHTFTIRFSGANGTWSVPLTTTFISDVSVEELPGVTELLLFPNPVTDQLGLRLSSDGARELELQVLDLTGSLVLDLSSWAVSGHATRQWDIGPLARGSYLLRILNANGAWVAPFVKQ